MKVYVAGKYERWAEVREVQESVRKLGFDITYDWTRDAELENGNQKEISKQERREIAIAEKTAVKESDVLIALMVEDLGYKGTYSEIGIAIGLDIPVIIIAPSYRFIFAHLSDDDVLVTSEIDKALRHLGEIGINAITCKACSHCGLDPADMDFFCGHPETGNPFGKSLHGPGNPRIDGKFCGPGARMFEQHPGRNPDGSLKSA